MLRYINYSVVFQEVPDEVTLAINISNCPHNCKGCHSPYLMEDEGNVLNKESLTALLKKYMGTITCICFMGGDSEPEEIKLLAAFLRESEYKDIKTAWYSGRKNLPQGCPPEYFDYIKLGPYVDELGGLSSPTTNQRFYKVVSREMVDMTSKFLI